MKKLPTYFSKGSLILAAAICALLILPSALRADDIRVIAEVESRDVYVGESFLYQITVDGSSRAVEPDMSGLAAFSIEYLGGSNNSSTSISIVNGRVQRVEKKAFIFTYRLTPVNPGRVTIPAVAVDVEGTVFRTEPITISVKKPEESEDFKLRISLSRENCFVGEPIILNVTWYLNRDVESFNFTASILGSDAFDFETPEVKIDQTKKYYRIPIGDGEVIAEKGQGMLDGQRFVTLSFDLALIPRRSGLFDIPEFIVACQSGTGARSQRDFFDDFFTDNFRGRWRGSLKKYVVPSNSLSLEVKPLPLEGRPEDFAGHVGELSITTTAEPLEVNVGDPITLNITIEGPDYLGRFELPQLSTQTRLAEAFRIPEERADGRVEGMKKVFTQTLRAMRDDVKEIPPIRIVYFDTGSGKYGVAESESIPIVVRPTRVVTASDAEGLVHGPGGSPLEKWKEGIAFNYEGTGVLADQGAGFETIYGDLRIMSLLMVFPIVFFATAVSRNILATRSSDPARVRARGALRRLNARLQEASRISGTGGGEFSQSVMDTLKEYLGDKLDRSGAALTADEVGRLLAKKDVDGETVSIIREVLGECEMWAYSGGADDAGRRKDFSDRVSEAARLLDRKL